MRFRPISDPDQLRPKNAKVHVIRDLKVRNYVADIPFMGEDEVEVLVKAISKDFGKRFSLNRIRAAMRSFGTYNRSGTREPVILRSDWVNGKYHFLCMSPIAFDFHVMQWATRQIPARGLGSPDTLK